MTINNPTSCNLAVTARLYDSCSFCAIFTDHQKLFFPNFSPWVLLHTFSPNPRVSPPALFVELEWPPAWKTCQQRIQFGSWVAWSTSETLQSPSFIWMSKWELWKHMKEKKYQGQCFLPLTIGTWSLRARESRWAWVTICSCSSLKHCTANMRH